MSFTIAALACIHTIYKLVSKFQNVDMILIMLEMDANWKKPWLAAADNLWGLTPTEGNMNQVYDQLIGSRVSPCWQVTSLYTNNLSASAVSI